MFDNVGPTHPKATETDADDVEGHRILMFVEDEKDAVLGSLPTAEDDPHDVQGPRPVLADDDDDDVQGHLIIPS